MNAEKNPDLNRRDFLRGGSFATLMMMMGGVPVNAAAAAGEADGTDYKGEAPSMNVGVIGCGVWGREIVKTLSVLPNAPIVAICDIYPAFLRRAGRLAKEAAKYENYKDLLQDEKVQVVVVATPSHEHTRIVFDAFRAGKHVYCEAPMATTLEDARAIAKAAQRNLKVNFQVGLQNRADLQLDKLSEFMRTGVLGRTLKVRQQWHKKQSWRLTSPNPDREKYINWRLDKDLSLGLVGEIGIHQIDLTTWYLLERPKAISGFGSLVNWRDGRTVPDNVVARFEYPAGIFLDFESTICNSFDAEMGVLFGSDCAIMMRDRRAWMFKEADAPLLGWEVYARKDAFYKESGVVLGAAGTKQETHSQKGTAADDVVDPKTALQYSLENFIVNSHNHQAAVEDFAEFYDAADTEALREYLVDVDKTRLAASGWREGYESAVTVIKANEAIVAGKRIELPDALFEV